MPNWCENTLEIYGEEEKMNEFYEFFGCVIGTSVSGKLQENFNFNHILPMPQELEGTRSPSNIVSQEEYDKVQELKKRYNIKDTQDVIRLRKENKITEEERDMMWRGGITQELSDRLNSEYGSDNWYDWANNNWGTKWDIKGDIGLNDVDTESCSFTFNTAWSPPEPIVDKLRDMFPELTFSGMYVGEGYEFAGVY